MKKVISLLMLSLFITTYLYSYDITIDDAINIASTQNKDILLKEIETKNKNIDLSNAKKDRIPNVNFSASYDAKTDHSSNGFSISKKIFDGFKVRNNIEKAKIKNSINDLEMIILNNQVKYNIVKMYMESLKYENQINIYLQSLERLNKQYEQDLILYNKKMLSRTDILKLQINISDMEKEIVNSQNGYKTSLNKLKNLLGLPLNIDINLKEKIIDFAIDINIENDLNKINNKSEILIEDYKLKNSVLEKKIVRADFFPELNLSLSYRSSNEKFRDMFSDYKDSIGLSLSYTLLDWGKRKNNYNKMKNDIEYKKIEIEQKKSNTEIELIEKYDELLKNDKLVKICQNRVELAQLSFDIESIKYEKRIANITDFLGVENELMQSEINLINQITEKYIKLYDYVIFIN